MKITERRIVMQDWYETEYNKTGWESQGGWVFLDTCENAEDYGWTIVEHIRSDKWYNPTLGIAEKENEIEI